MISSSKTIAANQNTSPITGIRIALALLLMLAACAFLLPGRAEAANISRYSSFACGYHSLQVYFPQLYTSSGTETVYYSPDLWKYTSSGWVVWDTSKPWYSATVGPNGIYSINGYQWFLGQTPYRFIPFSNLSPGYYMVKGYFYGGTSHWANVYNTNDATCHVS
jgi:hypothetical protein